MPLPKIHNKLMRLTRRLYPTGRAFRLQKRKVFDKLHAGLAQSESRAQDSANSILDSILADNTNFDAQDASKWEERLDIDADPSTPLSDRRRAILRKYNHPGDIPGRQHEVYLEGKLQEVFPQLYLYKNSFDDGQGGKEAKFPDELVGTVHASTTKHGTSKHGGGSSFTIIANHLDPARDKNEQIPGGLSDLHALGRPGMRDFFYIGPSTIQYADSTAVTSIPQVAAGRRNEFRQLILRLKPAQSIAIVFVEFV